MLAERLDERPVNRYQDPEGDTKLVGVCCQIEQYLFGAAELARRSDGHDEKRSRHVRYPSGWTSGGDRTGWNPIILNCI